MLMVNAPVPVTKEELIATLEDMLEHVRHDDSLEGFVEYSLPDIDALDGTDFQLRASYRTNNTMGQGGVRMIGKMVEMRELTR